MTTILSRRQVNRFLKSHENTKHKLLLSLSYGVGLWVSEVISLKVQDLDFEELTVHIKQSKGQKDRISIMSESLIDSLKNLVAGKDKDDLVFVNERGGKLTTRTAQKVFENALRDSYVKKSTTFHSLKHSFARTY